MLAKIQSGSVIGLEAVPITVEVDIASQGLPSFTIVGLPDKAVEESRERVRSAIKNSGAEFPAKRITVNLAPADLPKAGPAYDLPIALGILIASGQLVTSRENAVYFGELSLDGSVRHTNGILSLALYCKEHSISELYIPSTDAIEASIVKDITIYPVCSLIALFQHLHNKISIEPQKYTPFNRLEEMPHFDFDFADIQGQEHVKRAMEIAAAGGHNLFMQGPPGAGKTMLSRALPSILPELTEHEAIEVTKIYSVTGNLPPGQSVIRYRPFRAPHHTTSRIGLIGGGAHPQPGEISLAHRGVLFLDEFPEFPRNVLEALRQPIEDGIVHISRASGSVTYPAKFMLIGAANPCPCGNFGSGSKECSCLPGTVSRYQRKISGPILDRIDMHVYVPEVRVEQLVQGSGKAEGSESIRKRVQKARNIQLGRFIHTSYQANGEMSTKATKEFCPLSSEVLVFMRQAVTRMHLSARSYYRIIKLSRTIADLSESENISIQHTAEALQYRPKTDSLSS
jgi:magnesium chelatase family protein